MNNVMYEKKFVSLNFTNGLCNVIHFTSSRPVYILSALTQPSPAKRGLYRCVLVIISFEVT